ncbi:carbohydrate-binding module family 50 protein [Aulographum hederae CBS 113979]|uniref:Carbohydrate-binding module family 50 protein n=1 Tax=Aulographum hederae CBS 113979 TaxID=1176131 RepID=A0A6G1GSG3_9PEZI|nr:carbohydrate-binding module family 50 protein [Aulographum hederae CBS 113979]
MSFFYSLLVAFNLATFISGAPHPSNLLTRATDFLADLSFENLNVFGERSSNTYTFYSGDGTVAAGWPLAANWVDTFENMFQLNKPNMLSSCAQFNQTNPTIDEVRSIFYGIKNITSSSGVDARFILAIVMQESNGCVRVPTTDNGVRNPGLMQCHNGTATCNDGGVVRDPCPNETVGLMVKEGVLGTAYGDGLKQTLAKAGVTDTSKFYRAARLYNSGSIDASGDLGKGVATHCYASDVANRLTGWYSGESKCILDKPVSSSSSSSAKPTSTSSVKSTSTKVTTTSSAKPTTSSKATSSTKASSSSKATTTSKPATSTKATSTKATSTKATSTKATSTKATSTKATSTSKTSSKTSSTSPSATPAPKAAGYSTSCKTGYTIVSGDTCDKVDTKFGITFAQLRSWNTGLDSTCSNLMLGYSYCVKV